MSIPSRSRNVFRPSLDPAESRLLLSAGLGVAHPSKIHVHATHHVARSVPSHPASPSTPPSPSGPSGGPSAPQGPASGGQAWVSLTNQTFDTINFTISLAPYAKGEPIAETIGPNQTEYFYSGLAASGPGASPNFQVRFGSQTPIALSNTSPSSSNAFAYSIFQDSDGGFSIFS